MSCEFMIRTHIGPPPVMMDTTFFESPLPQFSLDVLQKTNKKKTANPLVAHVQVDEIFNCTVSNFRGKKQSGALYTSKVCHCDVVLQL